MRTVDWYLFKNLSVATFFVAIVLVLVIFLTQSLRFLELIMESGATSGTFWLLTFLALPRFLEVLLPIALMAATIFIYNKMNMDSELVAMRSCGFSPMRLARPALLLGLLLTVFLWGITLYGAPKALSSLQQMRQIVKTQFSHLLFREGVFNQVGKGLTVYMRERTNEGELHGIMIHDGREENKRPSTIMAKRGIILAQNGGHQVVVYNGARQEYDPKTGTLHRLNFERYTIDLPGAGPIEQRWQEPDERTIFELLNPDPENMRDIENKNEFMVEIHKRLTGPLLALVFAVIASATLILGPLERRGQGRRITLAIITVIIIEGLFISSFNIARNHVWGLGLMYGLVLIPLAMGLFMLSSAGENFRHSLLYRTPKNEDHSA